MHIIHCLNRIFSNHADSTAVTLVTKDKQHWSYKELEHKVISLAAHLRQLAFTPDQGHQHAVTGGSITVPDTVRIAIFLPRSLQVTQALLGIWKAGYVFVAIPTDTTNTYEQLEKMVEYIKPHGLITTKSFVRSFTRQRLGHGKYDLFASQAQMQKIYIDEIDYSSVVEQQQMLSRLTLKETDVAYLYFTSGSSGQRPKAVVVTHAGILPGIEAANEQLGITEREQLAPPLKILQHTAQGFDPILMETLMPLVSGHQLVLSPQDDKGRADQSQLVGFIEEQQINYALLVPSVFSELAGHDLNTRLTSIKGIITTGKAPNLADVIHWLKAGKLYINGYGPTETTWGATFGCLMLIQNSQGEFVVSIHAGSAWSGINVSLEPLSKEAVEIHQDSPEAQEIYLLGANVALGYWQDSKRTEKAFSQVCVDGQWVRKYRTGDTGHWLDNETKTQLAIDGRIDRIFKLDDAEQIIPEEIELALMELAANKESMEFFVAPGPDRKHCRYVVAFVFNDVEALLVDAILQQAWASQQIRQITQKIESKKLPTRWMFLSSHKKERYLNANHAKLSEQKLCEIAGKMVYSQGVVSYEHWKNQLQREDNVALLAGIETIKAMWCRYADTMDDPFYQACLDDNFYLDLGARSLQGGKLITALSAEFSEVVFSLYEFNQTPTLGYLLRKYINQVNPMPSQKILATFDGRSLNGISKDKILLVFIHSLTGNALHDYQAFYTKIIQKKLGGQFEVITLNYPGLNRSCAMIEDLHELSLNYISLIRQHYQGRHLLLVGWSLGGTIALSMQSILERDNYQVHSLLLDAIAPQWSQHALLNDFAQSIEQLLGSHLFADLEKELLAKIRATIKEKLNCWSGLDLDNSICLKRQLIYEIFIKDSLDNHQTAMLQAIGNLLLSVLTAKPLTITGQATLLKAHNPLMDGLDERLDWPATIPLETINLPNNTDHFFVIKPETMGQEAGDKVTQFLQSLSVEKDAVLDKIKKKIKQAVNRLDKKLGQTATLPEAVINLDSQLQRFFEQEVSHTFASSRQQALQHVFLDYAQAYFSGESYWLPIYLDYDELVAKKTMKNTHILYWYFRKFIDISDVDVEQLRDIPFLVFLDNFNHVNQSTIDSLLKPKARLFNRARFVVGQGMAMLTKTQCGHSLLASQMNPLQPDLQCMRFDPISQPKRIELWPIKKTITSNFYQIPFYYRDRYVAGDDSANEKGSRRYLLNALEQQLLLHGTGEQFRQGVLVGQGGVGKSWLAAAYAHKYAANYDVIYWFDANQPLLNQLRNFAETLFDCSHHFDTPDVLARIDIVASIYASLNQNVHRYLLIFDNAHNPHQLQPYLPTFRVQGNNSFYHQHLLVTSRYQQWPGSISVGHFTHQDAMMLFEIFISQQISRESRLQRELLSSREKLAKRLGYHPLSLAHGLNLIERHCWIDSIDSYLEKFAQSPSEIAQLAAVNAKRLGFEYQQDTFTALNLSIDAYLQSFAEYTMAGSYNGLFNILGQTLLRTLACLGTSSIPWSLINSVLGSRSAELVVKRDSAAILRGHLYVYAIVDYYDEKNQTLSIHPLMALTLQWRYLSQIETQSLDSNLSEDVHCLLEILNQTFDYTDYYQPDKAGDLDTPYDLTGLGWRSLLPLIEACLHQPICQAHPIGLQLQLKLAMYAAFVQMDGELAQHHLQIVATRLGELPVDCRAKYHHIRLYLAMIGQQEREHYQTDLEQVISLVGDSQDNIQHFLSISAYRMAAWIEFFSMANADSATKSYSASLQIKVCAESGLQAVEAFQSHPGYGLEYLALNMALGAYYLDRRKLSEAEPFVKKVVELSLDKIGSHDWLEWLRGLIYLSVIYSARKKHQQAMVLLQQVTTEYASQVCHRSLDWLKLIYELACHAGQLHDSETKDLYYTIAHDVIERYPDLYQSVSLINGGLSLIHIAAMYGDIELLEQCQTKSMSMNIAAVSSHITPLMIAALSGQLDAVKWLVEEGGASLDAKDNRGRTVAFYAVQGRQLDIVKWLLVEKSGTRLCVESADHDGFTLLIIAAVCGYLEIIQWLLKEVHANWQVRGIGGATALLCAAAVGQTKVVMWLLTEMSGIRPSVEESDSNDATALHYAVANGHLITVKYLLIRAGADPQAQDNNGYTALLYAASEGQLDIVKWLLQKGWADYDKARDIQGNTALLGAASQGHLDIVQWLLDEETGIHASINETNHYGTTAFLVALVKGQLHVARWLLGQDKASLQIRDNDGLSALMCAVLGGSLNVIRWLIDEVGVDIEVKDSTGTTALMIAASRGHLDIVQFLIVNAGADPQAHDYDGRTTLLIAARHGHLDIVKWFLKEKWANYNKVVDYDGNTALMYAAAWGHLNIVTWLLEKGWANYCKVINNEGNTPLLFAAMHGHLDIVRWLLFEKPGVRPSVEETNHYGVTPLLAAIANGHLHVAQWLLSQGNANLHARNNDGLTALMFAACHGHLEVVEWLIKISAKSFISQTDKNGINALGIAIQSNYPEIALYLVEAMDFSNKDAELIIDQINKLGNDKKTVDDNYAYEKMMTKICPKYSTAWHNFACYLYIKGQVEDALLSLRQALALKPSQSTQCEYAAILLAVKKTTLSEANPKTLLLEVLISEQDDSGLGYSMVEYELLAQHGLGGELAHYEAFDLTPQVFAVWLYQNYFFEQNDLTQEDEFLAKLSELYAKFDSQEPPEHEITWVILGQIFYKHQMMDRAKKCFSRLRQPSETMALMMSELLESDSGMTTTATSPEESSVIQQLVIQTERHGVAGSRRHQQRPQQQEQTSFSEVASAMNMRNS